MGWRGAASSTTYQKRPWCTGLVGERGDITVGILSEKKISNVSRPRRALFFEKPIESREVFN